MASLKILDSEATTKDLIFSGLQIRSRLLLLDSNIHSESKKNSSLPDKTGVSISNKSTLLAGIQL